MAEDTEDDEHGTLKHINSKYKSNFRYSEKVKLSIFIAGNLDKDEAAQLLGF